MLLGPLFYTEAITVPGLSTHITHEYIEIKVGLLSHLARMETGAQGNPASPELHQSASGLMQGCLVFEFLEPIPHMEDRGSET